MAGSSITGGPIATSVWKLSRCDTKANSGVVKSADFTLWMHARLRLCEVEILRACRMWASNVDDRTDHLVRRDDISDRRTTVYARRPSPRTCF